MISFSSVWGLVLRHTRLFKRNINLLIYTLCWPLLDVIIWGFLGASLAKAQPIGFKNYETVALLGVVLWQIIGRGCNQMLLTLTEELNANNMVNLFSLPLKISDWMLGCVLFTALMSTITLSCSFLVIFLLYDIPMGEFISIFLLFMPPLFISALAVGFMGLSALILLGKQFIQLGYLIIWFLLPFSGAYYSTQILPAWGKVISACVPMSYIFQGMRNYVMYQQNPTQALIIGYTMSIFYAFIGMALFAYCFEYTKKKGLARLGD